jgi:peptide/nickel transport system permease protein
MIDETLAQIELVPERVAERRERPGQSFWRESLERLRQNKLGMIAGGIIALLALIAICAPLISAFITHYDPARQDLENNFALPGRVHWLGTDELGRDTLTRLVWGARISLGIGFLTVAIQLTWGAALGMISGYYGRIVDDVTMRVVDVILAFPPIFLFIGLSILFRPSALTLSLIIAFVGWGAVARLVRGEVFSIKNRDFMLATRSIGARDVRLIVGHLLPNAMPVMIVSASLALGQIILIEAALDFLGLGIQPPTASWGNMLTNAQTYFEHSVWLVIFPGVTIFVTVLAANLFGNAIRDAFDPRLR